MKKARFIPAALLVLTASILPDMFFPFPQTPWIKTVALLATAFVCFSLKILRNFWKLAASLAVINASFLLTAELRTAPWWTGLFFGVGFFRDVAGAVIVKLIGILPVVAALRGMAGSFENAFLTPGKLSQRACAIRWLGIPEGTIPWGRLSVVSGLAIMSGTILLSMVTDTGFRWAGALGRFASNLPLILALALVNSFCEGLVFRSAILAPIRDVLPKVFVLLVTALFFGIAHYQGIPGGPLGAAMSGVLGWYMTRTMYETGGFASGWIIHFFQDVAVFSTLALMG